MTKTLAEKMDKRHKPFGRIAQKPAVSRTLQDAFEVYLKDLTDEELRAEHSKRSGVFKTLVNYEFNRRSPVYSA